MFLLSLLEAMLDSPKTAQENIKKRLEHSGSCDSMRLGNCTVIAPERFNKTNMINASLFLDAKSLFITLSAFVSLGERGTRG